MPDVVGDGRPIESPPTSARYTSSPDSRPPVMTERALAASWRESVFNVRVAADDGAELIFNTLTHRVLEIRGQLSDSIRQRPALLTTLTSWGMIVPVGTTTEEEYLTFFAKRAKSTKSLYLLLTTATSCNLACSYCFENRVRRTEMSPITLKATTDWIDRWVRDHDIEHISLTLFGGEPLLAPELAFRCLEAIHDTCRTSPAALEYVLLTTNGLHGDKELLAKLAEAGVTAAQVTFDGDHVTNNVRRRGRRNLLAGIDVYDTIMANLRAYARYFDLTVKVNFDKTTIETVPQLFSDLQSIAGLDPSEYRVKIEPIAIWKPTGSQQNKEQQLYDSSGKELAKAFATIIRAAEATSTGLDLSAMFPTPCMVSSPSSFLIEPDGSLRSCISAFGLDEFYVGSVLDSCGSSCADHGRSVTGPDTQDLAKCLERQCSYLPVCDGGCKYEVHLQGLPKTRMQCKIPYFDEAVPIYTQFKHQNQRLRFSVG